MLIKEEDTFEVKEAFLKEMLTSCIPDFEWKLFDYRDEDFQYNHNISEFIIEDKIEGIKVLQVGSEDECGYWERSFMVFSYKEGTYKINYSEGSHGYKYQLDIGSLKSVQPKVKEVIYYE